MVSHGSLDHSLCLYIVVGFLLTNISAAVVMNPDQSTQSVFSSEEQDLKAEAIQFGDEKPWLKSHPRIENCVSAMYLCVLEMVLSAHLGSSAAHTS